MKVQSQPQAAVIQQFNPTAFSDIAAKPTGASQLPSLFQDGFEPGPVTPGQPDIIDCYPPYPFPSSTMSIEDGITSSRLPMTLADPRHKEMLETGPKNVMLSRDIMGMMRGPEGQPLAQVWLNDGTTAFVDPNTNHYYLTDEADSYGMTRAMGPLDLPAGATFSNSYFSDPEVRTIQQMSQVGGFPYPYPPFPYPQDPIPEQLPRNTGPLPPLPLPVPGPIVNLDPSVLLAADAGKAPGLE